MLSVFKIAILLFVVISGMYEYVGQINGCSFFKQVGWCFLEKRTSRIHLQIFVTFFLEAHIAVTMFVSAPPLIKFPLVIFIMCHD